MIRSLLNEQARIDSLSLRERQVVDLTLAGLQLKQIAAHLHLGTTTVSMYRAAAYQKLRVTSTVELVKLGIRVGLITAD